MDDTSIMAYVPYFGKIVWRLPSRSTHYNVSGVSEKVWFLKMQQLSKNKAKFKINFLIIINM